MFRPVAILFLLAACADPDDEGETRDFGPTPGGTDRATVAAFEVVPVAREEHLLVPPAEIAQESSWCWFLAPVDSFRPGGDGMGLYVAGMDSATIVETRRFDGPTFSSLGIAYTGTTLVAGQGRWYELDLATGDVRQGRRNSVEGAVAAVGVYDPNAGRTTLELVGLLDAGLGIFPSFDALDLDRPRARVMLSGFTRLQVDGTTLYGAWHSTHELEVFDLRDLGADPRIIPLEGFDTWVNGIGVAGGMIHVLDGGRQLPGARTQRLARFDGDGRALSEVRIPSDALGAGASGLWCDAPEVP